MPRRRVTAAQRAASIRNLAKARKAKKNAMPMSKRNSVVVVHRTTPAAADAIVKHGFKPITRSSFVPPRKHMFVTTKEKAANFDEYGSAMVGVRVHKRHVTVDRTTAYDTQQGALKVPVSALKGRKIRRIK